MKFCKEMGFSLTTGKLHAELSTGQLVYTKVIPIQRQPFITENSEKIVFDSLVYIYIYKIMMLLMSVSSGMDRIRNKYLQLCLPLSYCKIASFLKVRISCFGEVKCILAIEHCAAATMFFFRSSTKRICFPSWP